MINIGEEARKQKYTIVVTGIGKDVEIACQQIKLDISQYEAHLAPQALSLETVQKL